MKYLLIAIMSVCFVSGQVWALPSDGTVEQLKATWALPEGATGDIDGFKLYQVGVEEPVAIVGADVFEAIVDAPDTCGEWFVRTYKGNKVSNDSTITEWCQPGTVDPELPVPVNLALTDADSVVSITPVSKKK
jgi:hypothetical protein